MTEIQSFSDLLLLGFAVLLLASSALVVWATILFFKVQAARERLERLQAPSVARDANGRRFKERV